MSLADYASDTKKRAKANYFAWQACKGEGK